MGRAAVLPALVCAVVPWLAPASARAQSPAADDLLRAGVQQRVDHRDADAFVSFTHAWEQCRCAEARVQMALAAQALGRWCDAASLLDDALRDPRDPFVVLHRASLAEARGEIAAHVGAVRVEADAPDARVTLDDVPIAPTPEIHCAAVGPHALVVTAPGRESVARALAVDPGALLDLSLALAVRPAVVPPSSPGASPTLPRFARTARWITLGTAVLDLAGAVTASAIEADRVTQWNDSSRCLVGGRTRAENCAGLLATADDAYTAALVGYITAGVLTAGTIVLWAVAARGPMTRERTRAMCLPDVRGAGFTCGAAF